MSLTTFVTCFTFTFLVSLAAHFLVHHCLDNYWLYMLVHWCKTTCAVYTYSFLAVKGYRKLRSFYNSRKNQHENNNTVHNVNNSTNNPVNDQNDIINDSSNNENQMEENISNIGGSSPPLTSSIPKNQHASTTENLDVFPSPQPQDTDQKVK